jgi:hypothetical protein
MAHGCTMPIAKIKLESIRIYEREPTKRPSCILITKRKINNYNHEFSILTHYCCTSRTCQIIGAKLLTRALVTRNNKEARRLPSKQVKT